MFDVGFFELLLISVVALLVLGPERLPHVARLTGALISKARRTVTEVKIELEKEVEYHELQQRVKELVEKNPANTIPANIIKDKLNQPIETLPSMLMNSLDQDQASGRASALETTLSAESDLEKSQARDQDQNQGPQSNNEESANQ